MKERLSAGTRDVSYAGGDQREFALQRLDRVILFHLLFPAIEYFEGQIASIPLS